jgi:hypothetical protein
MSDELFTTWADLLERLKDDLASRSFRTMQSYSVASGGSGGTRTVQYRGLSELRDLMKWVQAEAAEEANGPYPGRVCVANGGRQGRWDRCR